MQRHYAKLLRAMLIAPLMLVAVSAVAVAGPLEDANEAHEHGDDATAVRITCAQAEQGSALPEQGRKKAFVQLSCR